jgi:hypothetical protein
VKEETKEALYSRKFIGQLLVAGILVLVFIILIILDKLTESMFRMWLVALLADFGIYGVTNVAGKFAPAPGPPK